MIDVAVMRRRLVAHYTLSSDQERLEGRSWYAEALQVAENAAEEYGVSVRQAAYALAALSPNVSWPMNIDAFHLACAGWLFGKDAAEFGGAGYTTNKIKAARILSGDLDALQGPKVTAFAAAILGDRDACTLDVWMIRACLGVDRTPGVRESMLMRRAIVRAARVCGESVRDFQAIVWVHVRSNWRDGNAPR